MKLRHVDQAMVVARRASWQHVSVLKQYHLLLDLIERTGQIVCLQSAKIDLRGLC